jgi:hypothetical protein
MHSGLSGELLGPARLRNVSIFKTGMNCTTHLLDSTMKYYGPLDTRKWRAIINLRVPLVLNIMGH